jgi:hypothetical protein
MKPMNVLMPLLYSLTTVSAFPWFGSNQGLDERAVGESDAACNYRVRNPTFPDNLVADDYSARQYGACPVFSIT